MKGLLLSVVLLGAILSCSGQRVRENTENVQCLILEHPLCVYLRLLWNMSQQCTRIILAVSTSLLQGLKFLSTM